MMISPNDRATLVGSTHADVIGVIRPNAKERGCCAID